MQNEIQDIILNEDEIISIEVIDEESLIDIEVDSISNNLFFANNILTHNSGYESSNITMNDVSESRGLTETVDALFALQQDALMKTRGFLDIKAIALRNAEGMGTFKQFLIDYTYMRITEDINSGIKEDE